MSPYGIYIVIMCSGMNITAFTHIYTHTAKLSHLFLKDGCISKLKRVTWICSGNFLHNDLFAFYGNLG